MGKLLWEGTICDGQIGARIYEGGKLKTFALCARNVEYEPNENEALLIWPAAFHDLYAAARKVVEASDARDSVPMRTDDWYNHDASQRLAIVELAKKLGMDT